MAAAAFTGAQVEPAGHACVACVTVLGTESWWGLAIWGETKEERPASTVKEVGWMGGGPRLTWQEGPRYPGGQVHCSTSNAESWPVFSGTAMSMLMPEILDVTRHMVKGCSLCPGNTQSPELHHHVAFILLQSPGLWPTAHICCFLQRTTLSPSSPGQATLLSSSGYCWKADSGDTGLQLLRIL